MNFTMPLGALGATKGTWTLLTHFEAKKFSPHIGIMDECFADHEEQKVGPLTRMLKAGEITGELGEVVIVRNFPHLATRHLVILGLGQSVAFTLDRFAEALDAAVRKIADKQNQTLAISFDYVVMEKLGEAAALKRVAEVVTISCAGKNDKGKSLVPFSEVRLFGPIPSPENENAIKLGVARGRATIESRR